MTPRLLTQDGGSTAVLVIASTLKFGAEQRSYAPGRVDPGTYGTWYVYGDDPTYAGGAITYQATSTPSILAVDGRIYFGTITTASGRCA